MQSAFQFWHGGRTYNCAVVQLDGAASGSWWSFTLSSGSERYLPFRAAKGDTKDNVQERVIAYHTNFVTKRAQPPQPRHTVGRPPKAVQQARAAEQAEQAAEEG